MSQQTTSLENGPSTKRKVSVTHTKGEIVKRFRPDEAYSQQEPSMGSSDIDALAQVSTPEDQIFSIRNSPPRNPLESTITLNDAPPSVSAPPEDDDDGDFLDLFGLQGIGADLQAIEADQAKRRAEQADLRARLDNLDARISRLEANTKYQKDYYNRLYGCDLDSVVIAPGFKRWLETGKWDDDQEEIDQIYIR